MRERQRPEPFEQLDGARERSCVIDVQMFGPNTERYRRADCIARNDRVGPDHLAASQPDDRTVLLDRGDRRREQVHPRRADRRGNGKASGTAVHLDRRADLFDASLAHHDDAVGERHRLELVVRDVDHRRPELLMQPRELVPHPRTQIGVEVRQRLVEQQHLRSTHDRAGDGDTLPLAAG